MSTFDMFNMDFNDCFTITETIDDIQTVSQPKVTTLHKQPSTIQIIGTDVLVKYDVFKPLIGQTFTWHDIREKYSAKQIFDKQSLNGCWIEQDKVFGEGKRKLINAYIGKVSTTGKQWANLVFEEV